MRALLGDGNADYAVLAAAALAPYLAGALVARGFPRTLLGPSDAERATRETPAEVIRGLMSGAREVRDLPTVAVALVMMGAHRLCYGIWTVCTVLLYRNYFTDEGVFRAGLSGLGQVVAAIAAGGAVAALVTPTAFRRLGAVRWPAAMLAGSAVVAVGLGPTFAPGLFVLASLLLGFTSQSVKISVDTLIQQHVVDAFRGRVFAMYDMLFNIALVLAALLTAAVLPESGHSTAAVIAIAVGWAVTAAIYLMSGRHAIRAMPRSLDHDPTDPAPSATPAGAGMPRPRSAPPDIENRHDLVPVQVGADRIQLLLRPQVGDAPFERVVGGGEGRGLALVAGRAVGPDELVQPGQQRPRVDDVAAHRRVGPVAGAVSVEAQVEEHEFGDVVDEVRRVAQLLEPRARHLRADHFVVVKGDPAALDELARLRLADIVQDGRPAQDEVGAVVLEVDRLLEHLKGVCVHVLVLSVLVGCHAQGGQFGKHDVGQPRVDEYLQTTPGCVAEQQLGQLDLHPLGRDPGELADIADSAASTSGAIVAFKVETKRAARSMRSGSSANDSSGVLGVRSNPRARSASPRNGSLNVRSPVTETAIAFIVKSRRRRSSSSESPYATAGLRLCRS